MKRFNWLFGKDNFWLARRVVILGAALLLALPIVYFVVLSGRTLLAEIAVISAILVVATASFTTVMLLWISVIEEDAHTDAERGVKDREREMKLRAGRLVLLGLTIFAFLFWIWPVLLMWFPGLVILYLASINKPPFSRSMAWEVLKKKARVAREALRPQPAPQTVPVRSR